MLDDCKAGRHVFEDILTAPGGHDTEIVARWCKCCGTYRIDRTYDTRTLPGSTYRVPSAITNVNVSAALDFIEAEFKKLHAVPASLHACFENIVEEARKKV